jgi:TonB family protein
MSMAPDIASGTDERKRAHRAYESVVRLVLIALVLALPRMAAAQSDAGVPPPPPPRPDAGVDLAPDHVVSGTADSLGPIDETAEAVQRAEDGLADEQRRDAVRLGLVDGFYAEIGRTMRHEFHPDLVAIESERRSGMSIPEIALDELSRYGPAEAPRGPASVYTPEVRATTPEDQQTLQQFEQQSMLNAHTRWTRVEVHIIQDRSGRVIDATITHSSDSHSLDHAAIAAITSTAVTRVPPSDVLGDRQTIDSDWSFWAGEVVPYAGQAGCIEGPDGTGLQCTALGRPLLRTRVVLLDVHDAEHERTHHLHGSMEHEHATHARAPDAGPRDVAPELPTHAYAPPSP